MINAYQCIPKQCESLPGMIGSKIEMMQSIDF